MIVSFYMYTNLNLFPSCSFCLFYTGGIVIHLLILYAITIVIDGGKVYHVE